MGKGQDQGSLLQSSLCPQACGPTVHQACRQNMYLMGLCFLLASPGQGSKKLPDSLQGEYWAPSSFGEPTYSIGHLKRSETYTSTDKKGRSYAKK